MGLLMVAAIASAGGSDPREDPPQQLTKCEKVSVTPAQTSAAVTKARRAVAPAAEEAPVIKTVPMKTVSPKVVPAASSDSWLLSSRDGKCAPLASVRDKVKNIGNFNTPQEFSRQMQQRGYQAFVLDIGDVRDQEIRVKVPDLKLSLSFVKAGLCR